MTQKETNFLGFTPMLTNEVARALDRCPETIRLWVSKGRLPVRSITNTGVRIFAKEDIDAFKISRADAEADKSYKP